MNTATWFRFWDKVLVSDGCWEWTAVKNQKGYGRVRIANRLQSAHRVAYEMLREAIPVGLTLDHLCRNPSCVNPYHLEAVSERVNILRGESPSAHHARTTHCPSGHAYDLLNTYIRPSDGARMCRACHRTRDRQRRFQGAA